MAFRNLTDIFILMRNNAISSKSLYNDREQFGNDRTALVLNIEQSDISKSKDQLDWSSEVDQIQYEITKIKNKVKELSILHDKHLNKPTLDDNPEEERSIDQLTTEVTKMFNQCQMKIKQISNKKHRANESERRLITNVVNTLASSLQSLTINFRKAQNTYLQKVKSREERSKLPFESNNFNKSAIMIEDYNGDVDDRSNYKNFNSAFEQMQMMEENRTMLEERDKEILNIVRSIQDLNDLFKDLATMIVDQGTVLDRIDYNIEKVSVSVKRGLQDLQKASSYQKVDRKMYCIGILAFVVILLFLLLIVTKF